jgi:predicted DNA-binding transcriptional regulator AlpA
MRKTKRKHEKSEMRVARDAMMERRGCVDVQTAATLLGVSKPRAYALAGKNGDGPIITTCLGSSVYFLRESIEKYKRALEAPAGWLTLPEAMTQSHYSRSTLYQRAKAGAIKMRKLAGRVYIVTPIHALTR